MDRNAYSTHLRPCNPLAGVQLLCWSAIAHQRRLEMCIKEERECEPKALAFMCFSTNRNASEYAKKGREP